MPPDSVVVAPVSVRSPLGIRPGPWSLVEPCMDLTEDYGVLVGHTLVDSSSWSASVLMVNPSADVIVLPCFSCVENLVPVSAVSVAPDHLEDIVTGSHPSLERPVGCCSGTFSIGMHMFSRRPGNL